MTDNVSADLTARHEALFRRQAARELARSVLFYGEPSAMEGNPKKKEYISIDMWKAHLTRTFCCLEITDEDEMLAVAVQALDINPLVRWYNYSAPRKENGEKMTLEILLTFLENQFEPPLSSFEATKRLCKLRFDNKRADADIYKHNDYFNKLLKYMNNAIPEQMKIDFYNCTLSGNMQNVAIDNSVDSLYEAQRATVIYWNRACTSMYC